MRFPDFNDDWKETTLGEIAERVTRKNNGHVTSRPLTISAQYGLIDQRDFFNKIVASTSLEGYYLLNKGEFAYNRSSSADYPWGAIKRLESYENGALSTLYICFSLLQGYPSFIAHFFETSQWHEYIQSIAAEGARNHGLLNISVSDFFALPISLPTLAEQKKIADFLSLIDERITNLTKQLRSLRLRKLVYSISYSAKSSAFPTSQTIGRNVLYQTLGKLLQDLHLPLQIVAIMMPLIIYGHLPRTWDKLNT